jgi:hypothetical protein
LRERLTASFAEFTSILRGEPSNILTLDKVRVVIGVAHPFPERFFSEQYPGQIALVWLVFM